MKKQFSKSVLAASILGLVAGMSGNALAASVDGLATANVVPAITIQPGGKLSFGTFAAAASDGQVTVRASDCGVTSDVPHFGDQGCGKFTVGGYGNESYIIGYDQNKKYTLTHKDDPNQTMSFTVALNGLPKKQLLNGSGNFQFGGTVDVKSGQEDGTYSGTYPVSVDYE